MFSPPLFEFLQAEMRATHPEVKWTLAATPTGNLLLLFVLLAHAISGVSASWPDSDLYLSAGHLENISFASVGACTGPRLRVAVIPGIGAARCERRRITPSPASAVGPQPSVIKAILYQRLLSR